MLGPVRPPCETPAARGPDAPPAHVRWVLPATILGSSLGFIDSSVVNVALPAIQRGLTADFATVQWVVNGYMLTLAGLTLIGGAASDRFGRRRVFVLGLWAFAAASVACALAPSAGALVAARLAQGAAAALLTPASLALVGASYHGDARGRAIGTWAAAGALTTALGPPLGGWLVDAVGWRAIFYVNVPVAAVALVLARLLPRDRVRGVPAPLDLRGALLAITALALLCYGLIAMGEGRRAVGGLAVLGALPAAWAFVAHERRSPAPMLPLSLFDNATFSGANALTVLLYASLSGALFLLPFTLIRLAGLSPTQAGAAFLPFSIILGLGSRWSGNFMARAGARLPLMLGPTLTAAGYLLLAVFAGGTSYWSAILPGLIVIAIGMMLVVAPLTATVFDTAPADQSGTASGINSVAARAGGLTAVAALGLGLGAAGGSDLVGAALIRAYQVTMFAAAALAALSALTAAMTIAPARPRLPRP